MEELESAPLAKIVMIKTIKSRIYTVLKSASPIKSGSDKFEYGPTYFS